MFMVLARKAYVSVMGGRIIGDGSSGGLQYVFMVRTVQVFTVPWYYHSNVVRYQLSITKNHQTLFFMVPTTATIVCSTFAVSEFDNGDGTFDRFMTADPSIVADGARYEALVLFATIMVAVWVFGFPLALGALLFSHRRAIESRTSRRGGDDLKSLSFLFRYVGFIKDYIVESSKVKTSH